MAEFLLELFSEEIPARMQSGAARDLERIARERLAAADLSFAQLRTYAGPRRLTLVVDGLPTAQPDRQETRKGPRTNAPQQALDGFLRSTGLTMEQLHAREGVYYAEFARPGRIIREIVGEMIEPIVRSFPWPKSMRWGSGRLTWVRPLKRILCVLDGSVVPVTVEYLHSDNRTQGHRFLGPSPDAFAVSGFRDYQQGLEQRFVLLEAAERKRRILEEGRALCARQGLELVEDEGLLEEVAGLVEWPTPILGDMDPAFLDLPPEVIRTSMRTHQRYFAVRRPGAGELAPHFLMVANIIPTDGGALISAGNARVLRARLSDARFFWNEDRRRGNFEHWLEKLKGVVFHAGLGTMAERVGRIVALAKLIAPATGADVKLVELAARMSKADLASAMVAEFPELQGVMGGYYAAERLTSEPFRGSEHLDQAEHRQVAAAVRDHYKPVGPSDSPPAAPVSMALALADKLDTLIGFFQIGEKPTGSRDPYALRRAALGVIRLLLSSNVRLPLRPVLNQTSTDLLDFFGERLKVLLRDEGRRHDLVDAVFALGDDDIVRINRRVSSLERFLATDDGASLLAGYRRAANILRIEEKRDAITYCGNADLLAGAPAEESALVDAIGRAIPIVDDRLYAEDFDGAMAELARLRAPLDAFFDRVLVNDADPSVRRNRLLLLSQIRAAADRVADFSRISG